MGTPGTNADAHARGDLQNPETLHEHSDINVRGVVWFLVVLAMTCAAAEVGMWGLFRVFDHIEVSNDPFVSPLATPAATLPPEPRLQTTPWQDLIQFRQAEDEELNSYGWVDQKAGVAHMPIDKAKDLLLQRGIPTRQGPSDPTEGTHVYALGESNSAEMIQAGQADASSAGTTTAAEPGKGASAGEQPAAGSASGGTTAPKKPGGGQ